MIRITFLLIGTILFFSCSTDSQTKTAESSKTKESIENTKTNGPKIIPAGADSPFLGLWEVFVAFDTKSKQINPDFTGKWYNFNADNTFTCGKYQEETNSGKWSFDQTSKLFNFYYEKSEKLPYNEWKVNGVDGIKDSFVLIGNTENNKSQYQIRLTETNVRPMK